MEVRVSGYEHRTGEHCASTALRNLLHFRGQEISEPMVVGLAGGLGFFYLRNDRTSPTRLFHGRTGSLEVDFCRNTGIRFDEQRDAEDGRAWVELRRRLDAGTPVLLFTDTYYLGYHHISSHFPGHTVVAVGYDVDAGTALLGDRKFPELQTCSLEELRRSRNADDYAQSCGNRFLDLLDGARPEVPLDQAIRTGLRRCCETLLTGPENRVSGIGGMRALAEDLPGWSEIDDWSWAARFGYQVIVKRGAGGSFFRSLYADFLREAAERVPELEQAKLAPEMDAIAARWRELAVVLKAQSERETCDPELFADAAVLTGELADVEEVFFRRARSLV